MKLKRFIAGILSTAMLLSIGTTAFAWYPGDTIEDWTEMVTPISFTSTMYLSDDAITEPNVTYTYKFDGGSEVVDKETGVTLIYAGAFTNSTASLWDQDYANYDLLTDKEKVRTVEFSTSNLVANGTASYTVDFTDILLYLLDFTDMGDDKDAVSSYEAGVYHYVITEECSDDSLAGLINGATTLHLYLTFENPTDGTNAIEVTKVTLTETELTYDVISGSDYTDNEDAYKVDGFVHSYGIAGTVEDDDEDGDGEDEGEDEDEEDPVVTPGTDSSASQYFIVTESTRGTLINANREFDFFTLGVAETVDTGSTASQAGAVYKVVDETDTIINYLIIASDGTLQVATVTYESDGTTIKSFAASGSEPTYQMKDGDSYTVLGVVEGMTFTVTASGGESDSYAHYYRDYDSESGTDWTAVTDEAANTTYTVDDDYTTSGGFEFVTIKGETDNEGDDNGLNWQAAFIDTGVVLDLAPYAIMMVLALGAISFRFVRVARKTEE